MVGTFTYIGKDNQQLIKGEIYKIDLLDVSKHCYESRSPILIRKAKDIKRRERCAFCHNPNYGIGVVAHGTDFSYIYRTWTTFLKDWREDD